VPTDLERLVVQLEANTRSLNREMLKTRTDFAKALDGMEMRANRFGSSVTTAMARAGKGTSAFMGGIKSAGGFVAAQAGLSGIESLFKKISDLADVGDLSQKIGLSTDAIQALQYGAVAAGGSVEGVNRGLLKFAANLSEARTGSGELYKLLKANGMALNDIKRLTLEGGIAVLADLIKNAADESDQLKIAQIGAGKAGHELVGALSGGSKELRTQQQEARNVGAIIDNELIKKAQTFDDSLKQASITIRSNLVNSIGGLTSAFEGILSVINKISEAGKSIGAHDFTSRILRATGIEHPTLNPTPSRITGPANPTLPGYRPSSVRPMPAYDPLGNVTGSDNAQMRYDQPIMVNDVPGKATMDRAAFDAAFDAGADTLNKSLKDALTYGPPIPAGFKTPTAAVPATVAPTAVAPTAVAPTAAVPAVVAPKPPTTIIPGGESDRVAASAANEVERQADAYERLITNARQRVEDLRIEAAAQQMTTGAAAAYRVEQELLSNLDEQDIARTSARVQGIKDVAAAYGQLTQAAEDTKKKQEELAAKIDELRGAFTDVASGIYEDFKNGARGVELLTGALDRLASRAFDQALNQVANLLFGIQGGGATQPGGFGLIGNLFAGAFGGARAAGGPVMAGRPYLVGERGPELMVPQSSGRIVPNGAMGQAKISVHNYAGASITTRQSSDGEILVMVNDMVDTKLRANNRRMPSYLSQRQARS
jgi:hypothetical protein